MNSNQKKKPKVLVVAHDAGGAELIAGHIRKCTRKYEFHPFVAGLAEKIFKRDGIPFERAPNTRSGMARVIEKHRDSAYALIGTGWMTKIEENACREARSNGLKTKIYLDSWTNYRERFGYPKRGWQRNLPDEFWVGDSYAFDLAKRIFPNTGVRLVPNQYFASIIARYRVMAKKSLHRNEASPRSKLRGIRAGLLARRRLRRHLSILPPSSSEQAPRFSAATPDKLLFFSTPDAGAGKVFSELLTQLSLLKNPPAVLVRLHPADNRGRYKAFRKRFRGIVNIQISQERDIVKDLLCARSAIGPETMALAVAGMVGVKAVCIQPSGRKPALPFRNMHHSTTMKTAMRLLGY